MSISLEKTWVHSFIFNTEGVIELTRVVLNSVSFPALRAQSIAVNETTQYSFPSPEEIRNLALPNATLANISLTPSFLAARAAGKFCLRITPYHSI